MHSYSHEKKPRLKTAKNSYQSTSVINLNNKKTAQSPGPSPPNKSASKQRRQNLRIQDYLQIENTKIQKQLLACKAELYEQKYKNKVLKSKIEKLKKESEIDKVKVA